MTSDSSNELIRHGHEFIWRSDSNLCSVCGGTHGIDLFQQITDLTAQVEALTQELAGMRISYKAALREIDRLHNQSDEVKP